MKVFVPNYYKDFQCIAGKCRHTCCSGWEIEIDGESLARFQTVPSIAEHVEMGEDPHIRLLDGEVCPFLNCDGLCRMILTYGEKMLCQTCTDHPRFRNYWADRIEMGLGLVCEEAARLILSQKKAMELVCLSEGEEADGTEISAGTGAETVHGEEGLPEDERWLREIRDDLLRETKDRSDPLARLREYLIYRHIADALYDDRLEERIEFVDWFCQQAESLWIKTEKDFQSLVECVRQLSYDIEYDEERKEEILGRLSV